MMYARRSLWAGALALAALLLAVALSGTATAQATLTPKETLGHDIFFDQNLSLNQQPSLRRLSLGPRPAGPGQTTINSPRHRLRRIDPRQLRRPQTALLGLRHAEPDPTHGQAGRVIGRQLLGRPRHG